MPFPVNLAGRFNSGIFCTAERPCRQRVGTHVGRIEHPPREASRVESPSSRVQLSQADVCSMSTLERGYEGVESVLELVYQNYSQCVGLVDKEQKQKKDEFHIRFGRAIRQLR